jgi:uncharacterized protein YdeI (YjbR/CyaY-like superfamily)
MSPAARTDELPVIACATPAEWEAWLDAEHERAPGVWLQIAKKGTGVPSITQPKAVELALCFGWIDGLARRVDDTWFRQRFTPRRKRSLWSKINCDRATALIEAGRMRPAGLAEVERAKADGRWDAAYDGPRTATVPDDLQAALDDNPAAATGFAGLDGQNRFAILHRVQTAVRPETRARRIAKFVAMLADGDRLYP